ncbi:bifunctional metallophosphatase/5'-nucleotidase [Psychrosphaera ytuae]|uniref:Bifunctional metallophosphatase/5'-nucleotidase n=1 Tax=Psychrosphaera ytuae TaxID=2820710 RepID=A0A975HKE8_9GAMM|nr:5'-nucleotidase C-terminal domain-containing protein [Psychrosphaera ytuae]QTH64244.1 bifunctional metallophosphatase/5'-nucleotidase [Psychrosphaera ytuae]
MPTMKVLVGWCLVLWSLYTPSASSLEGNKKVANIVFSADMPLINNKVQGDYRQLAFLLNDYRNKAAPTFFLFGGGSIGPSPMSSFDKGAHVIDILNSLEPDVMSVTKREFIYFEDELSMRAYEAGFPILCSNLRDSRTKDPLDGLVRDVVITKNDVSLGIISLIDDSVIDEYLLTRVEVMDKSSTIINQARRYRAANVDAVVLIYSRFNEKILELVNKGVVDLAILVNNDLTDEEKTKLDEIDNHEYFSNSNSALTINLILNGQTKTNSQKFQLSNLPSDTAVSAQIEGYTKRLDRLLDVKLGTFKQQVSTLKVSVRSEENSFANLLADAMKSFVGSDVALINGGVIRGDSIYPKGTEITRRLIATELPFRSRVILLKVKGEQIKAALNNGVSELALRKGRFPHVSGMSYTIENTQGTPSVTNIKISGRPLDKDKTYTMATSDYIFAGGDGYTMFETAEKVDIGVRLTPLLSEVLISYIQERPEIHNRVEGRITVNTK